MIRAAIFSIVILCSLEAAQTQRVWFEPNQGQLHRRVEFLARSGGHGACASGLVSIREPQVYKRLGKATILTTAYEVTTSRPNRGARESGMAAE